jgi:hypothetical protein
MTNNYLSGKEIKEYMLDPKECNMCRYCFTGRNDGYCPQYDCWATDKCKQLTDRQWDNIAKKFKYESLEAIDVDDVWNEIRKKMVRK